MFQKSALGRFRVRGPPEPAVLRVIAHDGEADSGTMGLANKKRGEKKALRGRRAGARAEVSKCEKNKRRARLEF